MPDMKSPFKFLDSYTKDDRAIFFGRDRDSVGLRMFLEYIISPLQGSKVWRFMRWTLSNVWIFRAFSANRLTFRNALKGQNITKQDNVLFNMNIMIISPVRATYYKTGQRPVYCKHNDYQPCKGNIL